jgi:hypothetical protein
MAYKKPLIQQAIEKTDWKEFKGTGNLPESAKWLIEKWGIFKYPGGWSMAFYIGETPEKATDWIVVTNNGGFYKHLALYMVWHRNGNTARWTLKSMKSAVIALFKGEQIPMDPDYRT